MDIQYSIAKNGLKTFQINSIFFHSSYAPEKESERFTSSIDFPYTPSVLFVIEPGLNYCSTYLKEKFPNTKIYNIRFISDFINSENSIGLSNLESEFFTKFTSEQMLNSFIITFPAAEKLFLEETKKTWEIYKKHLQDRKTELISRQYFERKWLLNSINFFKNIKNSILLKQTSNPVLIVASGPSLKDSLQNIYENQSKLIIIGLSSAINTLLKHNIIPDFCLSTDGGFWATKHLKPLNNTKIPLAISSESGINKEFLKNLPIIPLGYKDGISSKLFEELDFPFIKAERNPTVSGTALILAKEFTYNKVYFAGLDLCCQKGFAHAQPNLIEQENSLKDNRIKNVYTRAIASEFNTQALEIFRTNFSLMENVNNCFRIINENITNTLGKIKNISVHDFYNEIRLLPVINKKEIFQYNKTYTEKEKNEISSKLKNFILKYGNTDFWKNNLFPIDFLSISHSTVENATVLEKQLEEKNRLYLEKIWRILND